MSKGQSLFEVVVAIAVAALVIVGVVIVATNSVRNSTFAKNTSQASIYSQQTTEWLRNQRDTDIAAFVTNATGVWCMPTLPDGQIWLSTEVYNTACKNGEVIPSTSFTREVTFSTSTVGTAKNIITASVSIRWTDSQGVHEVKSATNFADWRQR